MDIFTKILMSIVVFLLTLFPNNHNLMKFYQKETNSTPIVYEKVVAAFQDEDVSALENLMNKSVKEDVEDLQKEIQQLYDVIEGENAEYVRRFPGGGSSVTSSKDGYITEIGIGIIVTTTTDKYLISMSLVQVNTIDPEETGIQSIGVMRWDTNENLHSIKATNLIY